jgi:dTDP-4-amino-4,6-dideoxygalactose transaminase
MRVEFYKHNIGEEEKRNVLECLDGIFLTSGSYVAEFERRFAEYMNLEHCVALNSCTAALHLSLLALGIGPGDEVITTPMTFVATATAIMHAGARPVLVDVEPDTALIDPVKIEEAVTERTRAVIPVHLYGQMCDMRLIKGIAEKYGLNIIEDSAHCMEGERDGIRPGQLGDVACFSFYATKNITSGEGGAVGTNQKAVAEKIKILRSHGLSNEASERYSGVYRHWDMVECGWKYNMDNIQASLLVPQIARIDQNWGRRRELYDRYMKSLKDGAEFGYPKIPDNCKSAYHLFTIWVNSDRRDSVLEELSRNGIGVTVNYRAIHLLTYLKRSLGYRDGEFPFAEKVGASTISLPFYPKLQEDEVDHITGMLKSILNKA